MTFFESSFLWLEAVVASSAMALVCGIVGVYAILRRVVFLPAALSQVSGLGVVLAFAGASVFPSFADSFFMSPSSLALIITLLAALLLGWKKDPKGLSKEVLIGMAFVISSSLVLIIGDRIPEEAHHVEDVLFGNAVMVETSQMVLAIGTGVLVLGVHIVFFNPFVFVSFDRDTAKAHGVPTRLMDGLLFLSMGVTIAVATRTMGALPVFAYSILPAVAALRLFQNMKLVLLFAGLFGAGSAFVGYWMSFVWELPTGACSVGVGSAIVILAWPTKWIIERLALDRK